jgi:8-hydroxy-5-deazaflavin:NADPH oxidoreductase
MRIGIIGSGSLGDTIRELLEDAGHDVRVGNSGGGVAEAAEHGEIVVVAIPFGAYRSLPADQLAGRVVIDAMNYDAGRDGEIAELESGETTSSELLARHLAEADVIKTLNTLDAHTLEEDGRPAGAHDRLVLFVAGDEDHAKRVVFDLLDEIGFDAIDTGTLGEGGRLQQPGSAIFASPMTGLEAQELLAGG